MIIGELAIIIGDLAVIIGELAVIIGELAMIIGELAMIIGDLAMIIGDLAMIIGELAMIIEFCIYESITHTKINSSFLKLSHSQLRSKLFSSILSFYSFHFIY